MIDRVALEQGFRRSDYVALLPDMELVLNIGRRDADAERVLVALAHCRRGWAIVTPCNPHSTPASAESNRHALASFHRELRSWGGTWHAAVTRAPDWPEEPGALIVDPDPAWVHALAARFEQTAYVRAELGGAPELVWL